MTVRIFDCKNKPLRTSSFDQRLYTLLVRLIFQNQTCFVRNVDTVRIRLRPNQGLEDIIKSIEAGNNPCTQTPQLRIVSAEGRTITAMFPDSKLDELYSEIWRIGEGVPDDGTKEVRLIGSNTLDTLLNGLKAQPTAADPLQKLKCNAMPVSAIVKRSGTGLRK